MLKNTLTAKTSLSTQYVLTPQQVQYLRILQLPQTNLEQVVKQEIEENPFLEEENLIDADELDTQLDSYAPAPDQIASSNYYDAHEEDSYIDTYENENVEVITNDYLSAEKDSYDYYDEYWEDDADYNPQALTESDRDWQLQIKSETTLYEALMAQVSLLDLMPEDNLIAHYVVGNIDEDGYLRRDIDKMIIEVNSLIANHNFNIQKAEYEKLTQAKDLKDSNDNPAKQYELAGQSLDVLFDTMKDIDNSDEVIENRKKIEVIAKSVQPWEKILNSITKQQFEKIIAIIQTFEPPGIASRNIKECLLAQLNAKQNRNQAEELATIILNESFEEFSKKHFKAIQKKHEITEEELKDAFDAIRQLNPKPGGDDYVSQLNTIVPDFIVRYDIKTDDFIITLNDVNIPNIKVASTYEKLLSESKSNKKYNKQTREWVKNKYDSAKFFIQAIKQRSVSMILVMTAIVHRQRNFFLNDVKDLKPLIYKNISDDTALDISTVCRIVNDKYVHTSTGTYELKFFFSESLPSADGDNISTTVIKDKIKDLIASEPKNKPYSDDKLMKILQIEGYEVARRTIAKYREVLKIPVARLRKEM